MMVERQREGKHRDGEKQEGGGRRTEGEKEDVKPPESKG